MELGGVILSPDTSLYQGLKIVLGTYVPIDRDILHIVLGALVLGACLVLKRGDRAAAARLALIVALVLAIGMEALDARDDLRSLGHWRWLASGWDILRTVAVPLLAVLWTRRAAVRV